MGDPLRRREAVRALEYMIPECRPDLNCVVHDADIPFPEYLKNLDYDLIVLGPTFLCNRYHLKTYERTLIDYEFIRWNSGCKIALPQDDYDCSARLDDWMASWGVDRIYTVCPDNWPVLYPKSMKSGRIKLGYTGYVSAEWIDSWKTPRDATLRDIDVSYRASKLPANFGSLGQLKWEIAERFLDATKEITHLRLDISVDPKDMIPGPKWHSFLENSKFCITTASGSSLHDPNGEIRRCVNRLAAGRIKVTFSQFEAHCFAGQDNRLVFTALSPRNIEAALANTVQLGTPGSYSGLMKPMEHFIPLAEDCTNISDVLEMMRDHSLVEGIKNRCKESILSEPRLRREAIVDEIVDFAKDIVSHRHGIGAKNQKLIDLNFKRYKHETPSLLLNYWRKRRVINNVREFAVKLGARRVRDYIFR
jgi:hypothetical protein